MFLLGFLLFLLLSLVGSPLSSSFEPFIVSLGWVFVFWLSLVGWLSVLYNSCGLVVLWSWSRLFCFVWFLGVEGGSVCYVVD